MAAETGSRSRPPIRFGPVLLRAGLLPRLAGLGLVAVAAWAGHAAAEQNAMGPNGSISIVVDHVHDNKGHVRVDICTQPSFLKAECPYSGAAPAVKGVTTVVVPDVPPGVYAAQIYHDRNDNHTVDRRFGIPIEEIGFSNNAPVGLHGPKFEHAAFVHDTTDQNIEIKLRRFE